MKAIAAIKQVMFAHKAWPYPRGHEQVKRVILVTLAIIIVTLGCMIVGLKYEEQKTLVRQDVRLASQDITSYSHELLLLATHSQQKPLVQPYREVYVQQLSENLAKVRKKLVEHQVDAHVSRQAQQLIGLSDELTTILATYERQSDDQTIANHTSQIHRLVDEAQQVEVSL